MTENSAIYCRVSTQQQKEKGYSLAEQELICVEYNASKQYRVIARIHEQFSGASFERPKMDEIIEMAKRKQIQVVTCMELDRFARGPAPMVILEQQLKLYGARVEYVLNKFEATPEGDFMKTVTAGMAELERQKIKERMLRGKASKARSGKVPHSGIPLFGYEYIDGHYVIREDEAAVVRQVFDWYVKDRMGFLTIAIKLSEMRVLTRHDKLGIKRPKKEPGSWSQATVADLIHNKTYSGTNTWGMHSPYQKAPIEISVPPIVDAHVFQAAQLQAETNSKFSRRNQKNYYLLSGIMFCPTCGMRYLGATSRKGVRYYRCGGVLAANKPYAEYMSPCPRHSVKADVAETYVWNIVAKALRNPDLIIEALEKQNSSIIDTSQDNLDILQSEIDKLARQENKLLTLFLEDKLDATLLSSKADEIKQAKASLEIQYQQLLETQQSKRNFSQLSPEDIKKFCDEISAHVDDLEFEQKQTTLRLLQIKVVCDRSFDPPTFSISGSVPGDSIESGQSTLSLQ